ncbi:hypothetical protein OJAV_G00168710 [Oryzias javanicus]|uniref:Uncharacterized protein n=1 Tax=Oryzias javanicus TaxID=123683 RepID=A0A437CEG6_ORYJA|nr:hypothetical protein OJAV_G00168710 [Oryzias javanicus]
MNLFIIDDLCAAHERERKRRLLHSKIPSASSLQPGRQLQAGVEPRHPPPLPPQPLHRRAVRVDSFIGDTETSP